MGQGKQLQQSHRQRDDAKGSGGEKNPQTLLHLGQYTHSLQLNRAE